MAYTLAQFIAAAEGGNPIKITNIAPGRTQVILEIGGKNVTLNPYHETKDVDGSKNIDPITVSTTNNGVLDLGTEFSANEVLESQSLKRAISDGIVAAEAGTVTLSDVPTS
jgi:hypothetical protein